MSDEVSDQSEQPPPSDDPDSCSDVVIAVDDGVGDPPDVVWLRQMLA